MVRLPEELGDCEVNRRRERRVSGLLFDDVDWSVGKGSMASIKNNSSPWEAHLCRHCVPSLTQCLKQEADSYL